MAMRNIHATKTGPGRFPLSLTHAQTTDNFDGWTSPKTLQHHGVSGDKLKRQAYKKLVGKMGVR